MFVGIGALVGCLRSVFTRLPAALRPLRLTLFSSKLLSLSGEEEYLNERGTSILPEALLASKMAIVATNQARRRLPVERVSQTKRREVFPWFSLAYEDVDSAARGRGGACAVCAHATRDPSEMRLPVRACHQSRPRCLARARDRISGCFGGRAYHGFPGVSSEIQQGRCRM